MLPMAPSGLLKMFTRLPATFAATATVNCPTQSSVTSSSLLRILRLELSPNRRISRIYASWRSSSSVSSTEARLMVSQISNSFYQFLTCAADNKTYTIKKFTWESGSAYHNEGAHAKNTLFKLRNRQTNSEEEITVYNYFKRTYNIDLQFWYLPLIVTERAGMFPMELCHLIPNQRYNFKLSPDQVSHPLQILLNSR